MRANLLFLVIFVISQLNVVFPSNLIRSEHRGPKEDLMHRCCNKTAPHHPEIHEKLDNAIKDCKEELGEEESDGDESLCMTECLAKKFGVINNDTTINEDGFRSFVTNDLAIEDYQKAVADDAVTKCVEQVNGIENGEGCSKTGIELYVCISKEFFIACPEDQQDPSEHCQKMREYVNESI